MTGHCMPCLPRGSCRQRDRIHLQVGTNSSAPPAGSLLLHPDLATDNLPSASPSASLQTVSTHHTRTQAPHSSASWNSDTGRPAGAVGGEGFSVGRHRTSGSLGRHLQRVHSAKEKGCAEASRRGHGRPAGSYRAETSLPCWRARAPLPPASPTQKFWKWSFR